MAYTKSFVAVSVFAAILATTAGAATYSLDFRSDDQNTWASGDPLAISRTKVEKVSLDGDTKLGGITGSIKTRQVETPASILDRAAWDTCAFFAINVQKTCGTKPAQKFSTITIDERTGVEIGLRTRGELGVRYGYEVSAGEIDTQADYTVTANVPDAGSIDAGEVFNLRGDATRTRTELEASGPKAEASLDLLLDLKTQIRGKSCVLLAGCAESDWATIDDSGNNDREILAVTPNELRWLEGFTPDTLFDPPPLPPGFEPDGISITTPLANQTASFRIDQFARRQVSTDFGVFGNGEGVLAEVGNAEVKLPLGLVETNDDPNAPDRVTLRSDFLTTRMDVDTALSRGGVIISLGKNGPFSFTGTLDAYDIELGAFLGVYQNLDFSADLMVDLIFDKPVWIEGLGAGQNAWSGAWDDMPDMKVFETTNVLPTFSLAAMLKNATGIETGPAFRADLAKGSVRMRLGQGATLLQGEIGPALRFQQNFPQADFDIFASAFMLGGFQSIAGAAFTITPGTGGNPTPVPLPATAWLLLATLGIGASTTRRRRTSA